MDVVKVNVYTFNELSKEVQSEIIKRELNDKYGISYLDYEVFSNDIMANYEKDILPEIGFINADISYTGFWNQGDGASFTCDVELSKIVNIDEFCQKYKYRTLFVKPLIKHLQCSIVRNNRRYCHSYSVNADIEFTYESKHSFTNTRKLIHSIISDLEKYIDSKQIYYADKIYKELEKEYYSCYSEDYVATYLKDEANEDRYLIDGTVFNYN